MAENNVSSESCNRSHLAIKEQFDGVGKRLDSHSKDINSMQGLLVRLTVVQETLVKNQEAVVENQKVAIDNQVTQSKAMETIDNRVLDRAVESEKKFWESQLGERVITWSFILFAIIILAAIGQNVGPEVVSWFLGK